MPSVDGWRIGEHRATRSGPRRTRARGTAQIALDGRHALPVRCDDRLARSGARRARPADRTRVAAAVPPRRSGAARSASSTTGRPEARAGPTSPCGCARSSAISIARRTRQRVDLRARRGDRAVSVRARTAGRGDRARPRGHTSSRTARSPGWRAGPDRVWFAEAFDAVDTCTGRGATDPPPGRGDDVRPSRAGHRVLLREWRLPQPGGNKRSRGQVVVVGGSPSTPGAVMLAGLAALRVGAGMLGLGVAGSVPQAVAAAVPEAAVTACRTRRRRADGRARRPAVRCARRRRARAGRLRRRHSTLVDTGRPRPMTATPGSCRRVRPRRADRVREVERIAGRCVLTPNPAEAERLLTSSTTTPTTRTTAVARIANRFDAVVSYQGCVADPTGDVERARRARRSRHVRQR